MDGAFLLRGMIREQFWGRDGDWRSLEVCHFCTSSVALHTCYVVLILAGVITTLTMSSETRALASQLLICCLRRDRLVIQRCSP